MKTFDRIEDLTAFFNELPYSYPLDTSHYEGKLVLTPARLSLGESARYRTIDAAYNKASIKHVVTGSAKSYGGAAAKTLGKAFKGDVFGALSSYISMVSKIGDSDLDRIGDQQPDYKVYESLENAFNRYGGAAYRHVKNNLNPKISGPPKRIVGTKDGHVVFMIRV